MSTFTTRHTSVLAAMFAYAERGGTTSRITVLPDLATAVELDYVALADAVCRVAAAMAEHGVQQGDRVLLSLPTGPEFLTVFFGAQLLGVVPVAAATAGGFGGMNAFVDRFGLLLRYLQPSAVVAGAQLTARLLGTVADRLLIDGGKLLEHALNEPGPTAPIRMPNSADPAFIQFTSGSTGTPKGVVISQANLAANCEQIARVTGWTCDDVWVGWLPLHHDMGLICGLCMPLFVGGGTVLFPPTRFVRTPAEWLRHASTYRATVTGGPNFAFGLAADKIRDDQLDGVDLTALRLAFCGSETVHAATVQRFVDRFARWGMPADAVVPAYGMAEAGLAITSAPRRTPVAFDSISRSAAGRHGEARDVDPADPDAMAVTDCGHAMPATEVRIVNDEGEPVGDDILGQVQFRGPSRTAGYFELPDATAAALTHDGWWNTGDLGYLRAGGLRITGRIKDLIVIRGVKYFPADFELAIESVSGVRPGGVVAVGHWGADDDSESLHLIVETDVEASEHERLRKLIRAAVGARTGVHAAEIRLVPKHSVPKTTSGKVRRSAAHQLFMSPRQHADRPGM